MQKLKLVLKAVNGRKMHRVTVRRTHEDDSERYPITLVVERYRKKSGRQIQALLTLTLDEAFTLGAALVDSATDVPPTLAYQLVDLVRTAKGEPVTTAPVAGEPVVGEPPDLSADIATAPDVIQAAAAFLDAADDLVIVAPERLMIDDELDVPLYTGPLKTASHRPPMKPLGQLLRAKTALDDEIQEAAAAIRADQGIPEPVDDDDPDDPPMRAVRRRPAPRLKPRDDYPTRDVPLA